MYVRNGCYYWPDGQVLYSAIEPERAIRNRRVLRSSLGPRDED
jgi:hypothetical protein